jgi:hypothetical protein
MDESLLRIGKTSCRFPECSGSEFPDDFDSLQHYALHHKKMKKKLNLLKYDLTDYCPLPFDRRNKPLRCEIRGQFHQRSTRSFYVHKFRTQPFLCLRFRFLLYWRKTVGAKAARGTLMKLNQGLTEQLPCKIML